MRDASQIPSVMLVSTDERRLCGRSATRAQRRAQLTSLPLSIDQRSFRSHPKRFTSKLLTVLLRWARRRAAPWRSRDSSSSVRTMPSLSLQRQSACLWTNLAARPALSHFRAGAPRPPPRSRPLSPPTRCSLRPAKSSLTDVRSALSPSCLSARGSAVPRRENGRR